MRASTLCVALVFLPLVVGCGRFDCAQACRGASPICAPSEGIGCEDRCSRWLATDACVSEGEDVLECLDRVVGACNDGCHLDDASPGCVAGCDDQVSEYNSCFGS